MIEYVMGETMEIYLAVLFLWLITGLIFLINTICSHTWTDLVETLILVAAWPVSNLDFLYEKDFFNL